MSLVTRCPACGTGFRVQSAQLAAHSGTVRCGKCGSLFNGVAALVEEGDERLALEPSPQLGLFDPSRRPEAAAAAGAPLPDFLAHERAPRRALWTAVALLAAALLVVQGTYRYRAEVAVIWPQMRPPLEAACKPFGCRIPLPRRPELMSIDSSEVQTDPRRSNLIMLKAVIRNNAPFVQEYPTLELALNNEADQPLIRRLLLPGDYVDRANAARVIQGVAAGGDASVLLLLDPSGTRATGYRLCLVYPGYTERCR